MIRKIIGLLVAPLSLDLIWSLPAFFSQESYLHRANHYNAVYTVLIVNAIFAYAGFLCFAMFSYLVIRLYKRDDLRLYCAVMFVVSFIGAFLFKIFLLLGYESYYTGHTQIVEARSITMAGYLLELMNALFAGLCFMLAMAIFWLVAVRKGRSVGA